MKLISATSAKAAALGLAIVATLWASLPPAPRVQPVQRVVELPPVSITGQSERASGVQRTARTEPVEPMP